MSNFTEFMESLDEYSQEIVEYFLQNGHAGIRELSDLIYAPSDMDVLIRVKEVINPQAADIFGMPLLEFRESKIDSFTGDKVLFSWWLTKDFQVIEKTNHKPDIFDEKDHLRIITELYGVEEEDIKIEIKDDILIISTVENKHFQKVPLAYAVDDEVKKTLKNGVLEVKLRKLKGGKQL